MGENRTQFNLAARAGVTGATTVTLLNQVGKQVLPDAPRMDVTGERALAKGMRAAGVKPPAGSRLFWLTMLGDMVSNSAYYGLVGLGDPRGAWRRGAALGAAAGLGAAFLPQRMGLGRRPNARTPVTMSLTFAWYTLAGLAAAASVSRS